jgi:hypothetical protein
MPIECLNSLKPHNSSTTNPNPTWNGSLESYHLSLKHNKFQKIQINITIAATCPNQQKSILIDNAL